MALDRSIGALRRGLRDLGIADETLLWFKSDNGGLPDIDYGAAYPAIHPDTTGHLRGFKKDFYEGGLRVPAIIEWHGTIPPRISDYPASTMDIFPTLLDVTGLDPADINDVVDGISLAPVFAAEPAAREQPIGFRASGYAAWLDNDYKLISKPPEPAAQGEQTKASADRAGDDQQQQYELYNVKVDPIESRNLIDQRPALAARMKAQLAAWSRSLDNSAAGADYPEGRVLEAPRTGPVLWTTLAEYQERFDELIHRPEFREAILEARAENAEGDAE